MQQKALTLPDHLRHGSAYWNHVRMQHQSLRRARGLGEACRCDRNGSALTLIIHPSETH